MADAFSHTDALNLLKNKHVLFLGDSNTRAQYKDMVCLLTSNTLMNQTELRGRLEKSFKGDQLLEGSAMTRGRDYREIRHYYNKMNNITLDFMFITIVYNDPLQRMFKDFHNNQRPVPDVIVINSCIWDLTRWGPNGVPAYKENLVKLMRLIKFSLPKKCLVVWTSALPPSRAVKSSLLIKQIEFMQPVMRFEVMEANTFARETVVTHGFDFLDCHYHMRMQMHRRAKDGLHYLSVPVRFITNLLLTHLALSWDCPLPGNISSLLLDKTIALEETAKNSSAKLPTGGIFSRLSSPVKPRLRPRDDLAVQSGVKVTIGNGREQNNHRRCELFQEDCCTQDHLYTLDKLGQNSNQHLPTYWELPSCSDLEGPVRRKKKKKSKRNTNRGYPDYQSRQHYYL